MFINVSNHPSDSWSDQQLLAAREYGVIIDIPFPQIDPDTSTVEISALAHEYMLKIEEYRNAVVMVQGEFTFSYALTRRLREKDIIVVAACTRRKAEEQVMPDGTVLKSSIFEFGGFREYE